ncbi:MAG TPA: carboxypeptidase regulatory-like domain-containing protein [Edaphobacter sp.]|nr:carboxypeptidase regulatory-like domain-containing protein [Edaphobacter sp.]
MNRFTCKMRSPWFSIRLRLIQGVVCTALAALCFCSTPLFAQTATGSITGTVEDISGNVVVGAGVTLTNVATNETRNTTTNSSGYYSLTLLPPATYKIAIQASGFSQFLQSNIVLNVQDALKINCTLQVGQISQQVTVTGAPSQLQTETSSLGQVIANKTIVDLPVNGRNSYSFAALVPGVLPSAGFTQTAFDEYNDQFISINGARPNQNVFLLDGGMNTQPALNGPGFYPSIDMVKQYKVQTNNFSAQFSNSSGGVINVITKSGSNQFHGSLYEFYRSTGLNANNFFANQAGLARAPFHYNQFGGSLGGPILRDKTFFFFSYEGLRWTQAVTTTGTLPTAAERAGDFSAGPLDQNGNPVPIYDPFSTAPDPSHPGQFIRTQYPGNKIPQSALDPVAMNLLNYIPLPNQPSKGAGVNNFISNSSSPINKDDYSIRIDQSLSQSSKLFGRFSISTTHQIRPPIFGNTANFKVSSPILGPDTLRQMQATIDDTTVLSPNVVLELNSSFIRFHLARTPPGLGFDPTQLGFPSYFADLAKKTPPCFPTAIIGGLGTGESIPNIGWGGLLGQLCWIGILNDANQVYHENGNLTIVAGTHTLKMGGDFGIGMFTTARFNNGAGFYVFGPDWTQGPDPFNAGTGVGFASFLLGAGDFGFNYTGGPNEINSFRYYGGYFQDDWKVTPSLTLNLGIRYDYNTPWRERDNRITDWDPTSASPLQVPGMHLVGGLSFPGVNGLSRYQFNPDKRTGIQPRLGFSYGIGNSMVVRGGFGIFMGPTVGSGYNNNGVPNTGFIGSTPWVTTLDGVHPLNLLRNPYPQGFIYATGSSQGLATDLGQSVVGMDRNRRTAYSEQWDFDVQRTLPKDVLVDLAYAGSHGVHLYGDYNANQLPDQYLSMGSQLLTQVPNPFYGHITTGALSGPTVARSQLLLPYPQFTGVTLGNGSSYGASVYNSLQLKVERRFSNGFSILGSYTWSKLMDNVGATTTGFPGGTFAGGAVQDWDNLRAEWSLATFDTPNYLAINGIYELPFGKGRRWAHSSRFADYLIGGWQLNGIATALSGTPQQVSMAANTLFNNGGTQRANWNGKNPTLHTPISKRLDKYFNVSDFSAPAAFTYGNSPRTLGSLRAPGVANLDLSGIKNTHLFEDMSLQFRAEAFNIFNHPQFGPPDTNLGDGTTGTISTQVNNPRELQFALKLIF